MEKATTTQYEALRLLRGASMHHSGPASRTFGRSAVGLRPILDTNPCCGAPQTRRRTRKNDQTWR